MRVLSLKTSAAGIALIERFEGLKLRAYQDGNGRWTAGYGHLETSSQAALGAAFFETQAQAEADLCADLATAEAAVNRLVTVPLTQGQFDSLVSWTYNEGQGRLASSSLLRLLNAGSYTGAAKAFGSWEIIAGKHSDGLAARRDAEVALFNGA
jgi:lysozyme